MTPLLPILSIFGTRSYRAAIVCVWIYAHFLYHFHEWCRCSEYVFIDNISRIFECNCRISCLLSDLTYTLVSWTSCSIEVLHTVVNWNFERIFVRIHRPSINQPWFGLYSGGFFWFGVSFLQNFFVLKMYIVSFGDSCSFCIVEIYKYQS